MRRILGLFGALLGILLMVVFLQVPGSPDPETEPPREARRSLIQLSEEFIGKLKPLHTELGAPGPSDWLAHHDEPGQTFAEYLASDPVTPTDARKVLYVQPLGTFTEKQRKVIDLSAEYMGLYFTWLIFPGWVATRRQLSTSTEYPAR